MSRLKVSQYKLALFLPNQQHSFYNHHFHEHLFFQIGLNGRRDPHQLRAADPGHPVAAISIHRATIGPPGDLAGVKEDPPVRGRAAEHVGDQHHAVARVRLGDKRLDARLVKLCDRFSDSPESPINQACADWAESKGKILFLNKNWIF